MWKYEIWEISCVPSRPSESALKILPLLHQTSLQLLQTFPQIHIPSPSHFAAKLAQEKLLEVVPNPPLCLPLRLLNRHSPGTNSLSSSVSQKSFLCSNFNPFYPLKCVQGARENELATVPCLAFLSLAIMVDPQRHGEKLKQTLGSNCWLSCARSLFCCLICFLLLILILFRFPCLSSPACLYLDFPVCSFSAVPFSAFFYLLSWFLPSIFIPASPLLSCFYFGSLDELLKWCSIQKEK